MKDNDCFTKKLLSFFSTVTMAHLFASDIEQNAHEVDVLRSTFKHVNPLLLMGDMNVNCGPIATDGPFGEGFVYIFIFIRLVLL